MKKQSAGILLYRFRGKDMEVFLVHPGGPFWKNKDAGTWSIPKGEYEETEDPLTAAVREFKEETGHTIKGSFLPLTSIKQKSGKWVQAWALEGELDETKVQSNFFEIEWPPGSGKQQAFPEVDKAAWFNLQEAKEKLNPAQVSLLNELEDLLQER
ncbi:MAG TPA: NUDIX domain-containing protein [Chitinophagaceae bacterium]|nr:NUDIX domain-containing protein [Chitinophagaceae bacterium]